MTHRFHVAAALAAQAQLELPDAAARHVQVLRLQPGAALTLFNGDGTQWQAEVLDMGRKQVRVKLLAQQPTDCELPINVTLAVGMPANERMDGVVEKATELGATAIQPLVCERSVLRLAGDRAERKAAHWQAVAVAACEQSGRNRVPLVAAPMPLAGWLASQPLADGAQGLLLSLAPDAAALLRYLQSAFDAGQTPAGLATSAPDATRTSSASARRWLVLSGPEGGLSPAEQALAQASGFVPVSLGPRVLRGDTAPLAALATLAAWSQARQTPPTGA